MERANDTETKRNVCSRNRPRPTELRLLYNLYQHIFSSFLQVLHRVDQLWASMAAAYLVHQTDLEQDMDLPADRPVMLLTALEAMADLPLQLPSVTQVFHHLRPACLLARQVELQQTSSLPRPDSMAHRQPLVVPRVSGGLLAMLKHRGKQKRREETYELRLIMGAVS
jgi:hypothetical protein